MKLLLVSFAFLFMAVTVQAKQPSLKDTYMALQATGYAIEFLARHAPVYWVNSETGYQGSSAILSGHRDDERVLMRTCLKAPYHKAAEDVECQQYYMVPSERGWVAEHDPAGSIGIKATADKDQVYRAACYRVQYEMNVPKQQPFNYNGTVCKVGKIKWKVMP